MEPASPETGSARPTAAAQAKEATTDSALTAASSVPRGDSTSSSAGPRSHLRTLQSIGKPAYSLACEPWLFGMPGRVRQPLGGA